MKKRVLAFVLTINLLFISLAGKLFSLAVLSENVSSITSSRTKDISAVRGTIYDRNLFKLTNNKETYCICINPTAKSLSYLTKTGESEEITELVKHGNFVIKKTDNPNIYNDCEDIKAVPVFERYKDDTMIHILGYTDQSGNGICGIEKYYNDLLKETGGTLSVNYVADANGRVLTAENIEIRDSGYYNTGGIALTVDSNLQETLETALKNGNITKGAGIILDTTTNEILACASLPSFSRENIADSLSSNDAPFINRAFSAFPVGSVFKVVTAAAALENNITLENYCCNGKITIDDVTFFCSNTEGHGTINFFDALSKSCNPYFIDTGIRTGPEKIIELSEKLHFGKATEFGNKFCTDSGILPESKDFLCDADTSNISFGQGKLTATPLQIATVFSAIGNGGYYIEPTLIKGFVDRNNNITKTQPSKKEKVFSESTCQTLKDALEMTTISGTGIAAKSDFFTCCTKTATAQSGQYNKQGKEINICWFVGFFPKENPQYTICIMKEDGSSGGSDCGPVFKEIAENILFNF